MMRHTGVNIVDMSSQELKERLRIICDSFL